LGDTLSLISLSFFVPAGSIPTAATSRTPLEILVDDFSDINLVFILPEFTSAECFALSHKRLVLAEAGTPARTPAPKAGNSASATSLR